jgi:hypothetical protein
MICKMVRLLASRNAFDSSRIRCVWQKHVPIRLVRWIWISGPRGPWAGKVYTKNGYTRLKGPWMRIPFMTFPQSVVCPPFRL